MINIFTLFLFLLTLWMVTLFITNSIHSYYIYFGFISSITISIISWKLKLIDQNSNFIYLNIGFYKYFVLLILYSFFKTLIMLIEYQLFYNKLQPSIYYISTKELSENNLNLLISTIFFIPGIMYFGVKNKQMMIHCLDKKYFKRKEINKIYSYLTKIDENRLI